MNILIIEDEAIAARRIREMIEQHFEAASVVGVCDSIEESIRFFRSNPTPDLMLMDIELSDGQSFEIFDEVEITCPVIFTTAYDEFALKAFRLHSIDYLLKPIQLADLERSIAKFRQLQKVYGAAPPINAQELIMELRKAVTPAANTHREHFLVRQGHRLLSIAIGDIAYFYSEERVTFLKTFEGKFYALDHSLEELEAQVDPRKFFRASRAYLVERRSIVNVYAHFNGKYKAVLKPPVKDDLLVSRERASEFKKWLGG